MTPDGIRTEDWDRVEKLAGEIADSTNSDDDELCSECVQELLKTLDDLEAEYGPRPSILATRADYCNAIDESLGLLKRAYDLADSEHDFANMTFTSSSIAEKYIEEVGDVREGRIWSETFRKCLDRYPDDTETVTFRALTRQLEELEARK